ncbi:MAG: SIS domain-containing protein [Candidatus Cloacimonetes bacterium]|nr:SIS domain-containing protein [Candidatus Cloacimonadota bacterium]
MAADLAAEAAGDVVLEDFINIAAEMITMAFLEGNKVLSCGNGGSMADAMHFAEEFSGRYRQERKALPAMAIADAAHITCAGNDYGFAEIFARGIEAWGREGDILVGLTTSGNSANIIRAVEQAKTQNMKVILLLGKDGGQLAGKAELEYIAAGKTTDRIQELHMLILHIIIETVERKLFPGNYREL